MLMMEKSVTIVILMYCTSISLLTGQFVIADVFGFNLTDLSGNQIKPSLLTLTNTSNLNYFQANVTNTSQAQIVANTIGLSASMAWELVQLLTGTYIFNLMYILGIPAILVIGISLVYIILLMRMVLGYVRGI